VDMEQVKENIRAVIIANGLQYSEIDEFFKAWQHLIDTGLAWKLRGAYPRSAQYLIDLGYCKSANEHSED